MESHLKRIIPIFLILVLIFAFAFFKTVRTTNTNAYTMQKGYDTLLDTID